MTKKVDRKKAIVLLIVDDHEPMRRLIREIVKGLADEIHECSDGAGAFEAYARHHPDWVLMDIRMKEVDGMTATKQIREAFSEAKIIIITEHDDGNLRDAALSIGACDFIVKENLLDVRRILIGDGGDGLPE